MTTSAEHWAMIRAERNRLLAETDWMGVSDVTMASNWTNYRQSLRDLPADQSSVTNYNSVVWTTKPS